MPRLSILYIDALAADYIDESTAPTLSRWWDAGGGTRLEPLFAFKGVGASMFTGEPPCETGIWSDFRIQPDPPTSRDRAGVVYRAATSLPAGLPRKAAVTVYERFLEGAHVTPHRVPASVRPQLEPAMRSPLWEPGAIDGCPTVFDRLRARERSVFTTGLDGGLQERLIAKLPDLATRPEDLVVVKVNLLDHLGHKYGPGAPEVRGALEGIDAKVQAASEAIEASNEDRELLVVSDHGMTPVGGTVDLRGRVRARAELEEGVDYTPYYNSTSACFRWHSDEAEAVVREEIAHTPGVRVLTEDERERLWVDGIVPTYADDIVATEPGTVIAPDFYRHEPPQGMHGFATSEQEAAVLISPTRTTEAEGQMWDVAATVLGALDVGESKTAVTGQSLYTD